MDGSDLLVVIFRRLQEGLHVFVEPWFVPPAQQV